MLNEDKRYFEAADLDKDNFLTKEEYAAFQNPESFDHMFPALVQTTLEDKDKNGDGKISLEEFLGDGEKIRVNIIYNKYLSWFGSQKGFRK